MTVKVDATVIYLFKIIPVNYFMAPILGRDIAWVTEESSLLFYKSFKSFMI